MKEHYLETVSLIERLHRLFLDVIKCELDNLKVEDINSVQTLVLYNLGGEQISIGELTTRGCYLGSNVSYNLKKMVQYGYIDQVTSKHDKRSYIIKLSNKGASLYKKIDNALDKHIGILEKEGMKGTEELIEKLQELEGFWGKLANQRMRMLGASSRKPK
ncbi:MAG: MarR family winged helix-turn-helix transcriptional regulator [Holosporaceae bacterium]|jgi:DNA-binding MarR family transcriptional regulator|nr:MarR family winged helix-turn-helix transcriptional regulator [Holosporaceae bacterium]